MSNVRKVKQRPRRDGSVKTSWRASAIGADGVRQSKNFDRKGDADAWLRDVASGAAGGSSSMTLAELAREHLRYFDGLVKIGKRQAVTFDGYQTVLSVHIERDARFARARLNALTSPAIQGFLDDIVARTGSTDLAGKVRRTLVTWCKFGQRRGWLATNPAQPCKVDADSVATETEAGFVLPPKAILSALLAAAGQGPMPARDTAVVRLLMFGGLRASELLGLADDAVTPRAKGMTVAVRERLCRHHRKIGPPKSSAGRREIPLGEAAALAVRAWRMARGPVQVCDHIDGRLMKVRLPGRLFPNPTPAPGSNHLVGVWGYNDFHRHCWLPLMRRAGLVQMLPDSKGKNRPVMAFGPHMLRHVAASLWIAQGLRPKRVQTLLGHATLQMTMDLYGHLWTDPDEDDALAAASEALVRSATGNAVP